MYHFAGKETKACAPYRLETRRFSCRCLACHAGGECAYSADMGPIKFKNVMSIATTGVRGTRARVAIDVYGRRGGVDW